MNQQVIKIKELEKIPPTNVKGVLKVLEEEKFGTVDPNKLKQIISQDDDSEEDNSR
jgi:hypothetical protein